MGKRKSVLNSASESKRSRMQSNDLPVFKAKESILSDIRSNQAVIVVGATGSGKTTQIPQFMHEAGFTKAGMVAVTQPRRVAALSIAQRVASEMNCRLGGIVGYSIRFEDCTSSSTRIKYMTDGMLLRELLNDSNLSRYSVIILDEAHERTLRTDVLFGAVKAIMKRRPTLKLIVMSATLNSAAFSHFFNAKVVDVAGRQFPVQTLYASEPQEDYADACLVTVLQIHKERPDGDILVFLTGQEEIENMEKLLNEHARALPAECDKLLVCPIFASLPTSQQAKVFDKAPANTRKVILSTNIAETSITISGVRYVVDTGMVKVRSFNPKTGIESLSIQPVSKASANQRAGRAGREAPGTCFRLFTEKAFKSLPEETEPEIKRCNLAMVLLLLKASGIDDLTSFDFMDKPSRDSLVGALETLYALGALSEAGSLTSLGRQMAMFPLEPTFAKVLILSKKYGCTKEAISVVSMLSVDPIFFVPSDKREEAAAAKKQFLSYDGDHATLLNTLKAYTEDGQSDMQRWCSDNFVHQRSLKQVLDIRNQLESFCKEQQILTTETPQPSNDAVESLLKCLLGGFFRNVAIRQHDGTYRTLATRQTVHIHPSSVLFGKNATAVMFTEWVHTSRQYLRNVSAIQPGWLNEIAPHYFNRTSKSI